MVLESRSYFIKYFVGTFKITYDVHLGMRYICLKNIKLFF